MHREPEIDCVSVVLIGNFNPAIFSPAWFEMHRLLREGAADAADVKIVHPQIAEFGIDWLRIHVEAGRFLAETQQAPHIRVRDLVARMFKELLSHTPMSVFGINREVHFLVQSTEERDRVGRMLAPIEPWGQWAADLGPSGSKGGMTSLTMTEISIEGRPAGDQLNVTVEPSRRIGDGRIGVYVRANDHYTAKHPDGFVTAESLVDVLEENFESSIRRSEAIINHVMLLPESERD